MQKKLILATVLGGLTLFLWGFISHSLLGWYAPQYRTFTNQDAVEEAIVSGVSGSGLFLLPNMTPQQKSLPSAERAVAEAEMMERLFRGPMVFAVIRVGPSASFPVLLLIQLLLSLLAALTAAWLLYRAGFATYGSRVAFVAALSLPIVLWAKLPAWNWWSFPAGFTFVESVDALIGWTLLGVVLGRLIRPEIPD